MMIKQRVGKADTLFFCVYQGSRKKIGTDKPMA